MFPRPFPYGRISWFQTIGRLLLLFLLPVILLAHRAGAQGFLKASGSRIVNERGENVLLRGIGLGGWMLQEGYMLRVNRDGQQHRIRSRIDSLIGPQRTQEFYTAWLHNHTTRRDVDSLKAWGFNSIRLPMHYNLFTLPVEQEPSPGENTWLETGFALTDSLLSWCRANGMYLILDLHAAPGGQGHDLNISDADPGKPFLWDSEANRRKTVALWRRLAARYANDPWIGGYDILNEPNWGFADPAGDPNGLKEKGNGPLRQLLQEITAAIREVDHNHIIIIEGNGWGNNYEGMLPPWDSNMVLSFHKYWNFNDPGSIAHILKMREQYHVPVWLGETGENSNVWFTQAVQLLEANNIGWAWWPLKKMGANNPMEIFSNPGYDSILAWWTGRGPKPDAAIAYRGLMQLAKSARLENTFVHRDVLDALFRQPRSAETLPFKRRELDGSVVIAAADYDLGRNGYAYFDRDTADYRVSGKPGVGNRGRTYRNDGVDIRRDSSEAGTFYVSDFEEGEWLQYTVQVKQKGRYVLSLQFASGMETGIVTLLRPDGTVMSTDSLTKSKADGSWRWMALKPFSWAPGTQVFRIRVDEGNLRLKAIRIRKTAK